MASVPIQAESRPREAKENSGTFPAWKVPSEVPWGGREKESTCLCWKVTVGSRRVFREPW